MGMIDNDWLEPLRPEFSKPYYKELYMKVKREYETREIFPPADDIFNAYLYTPLHKVKVVILGQDPYHGNGQAHGLSFSVLPGVEVPPSLQNIYQELQDDLGCVPPGHGCLKSWAEQGVLLLNTVLTVRAHQAHSHRGLGWESFTDATIHILDSQEWPIAFILWGAPAQQKRAMLHNPRHLVLTAPHPSPLSAYRGFFGSRPFSKVNDFLEKNGEKPIDWQLLSVLE